MNNLIYAGVILFGAITLVIEARRNYSVSAKHHPFAFYGILEHLEARHLCSPREWNFGFYVYSLLYLISYAILLSSTELVELIYSSNAAANLVGATGTTLGPTNDPFDLSGTDYGKPLFISAFIIAFYSVGATRNIELHIRTLAHRLAGVPRGVYQVLDRLQDPDFLSETTPPTGPLMASFREKLKTLPSDEDVEKNEFTDNLLAVSRLPLDPQQPPGKPAGTDNKGLIASFFQATHSRKKQAAEDSRPKGKEQYLFDICKALRVIDLLRPAIVGSQRATHFPLLGMSELGDISKTLDDSIGRPGNRRRANDDSPKTLHDEIVDFKKYDEASLERLREKAIEVANSARAVFAVYFICNSRTVLNVDRQSALQKVRAFADRGYKVEQNSFAGALFVATIISAFCGFAILHNYAMLEANRYPFLMANEVFAEINPAQKFTTAEDCKFDNIKKTDACKMAFIGDDAGDCEQVYLIDEVPGETATFNCMRDRYLDCSSKVYSKLNWDIVTRNDRAVPKTWPDDPPKGVSKGYANQCMAAKKEGWAEFRKKSKSSHQQTVFFDILSVLLMIAAVVQMSIFEKDVRMDQNAWRSWSLSRIPYVRYLTGAILPAISGVIALSIGYVLRLIWNAGFDVTISQIEFLFVDHWQFFIAYLIPCFFLSISIFVLIDKHDHWKLFTTVTFAVLAAIVHVLLVCLVPLTTYDFPSPIEVTSFWGILWESWSISDALASDGFFLTTKQTRDAWSFCLLPVSFLIIFAFFVEISEDAAPRISQAMRKVKKASAPKKPEPTGAKPK